MYKLLFWVDDALAFIFLFFLLIFFGCVCGALYISYTNRKPGRHREVNTPVGKRLMVPDDAQPGDHYYVKE